MNSIFMKITASALIMITAMIAMLPAQVFAESAAVPVYLHYRVEGELQDATGIDQDDKNSDDSIDELVEESSVVQTGDTETQRLWYLSIAVMIMSAAAIMLSLINRFSFNSRKRRKGIRND